MQWMGVNTDTTDPLCACVCVWEREREKENENRESSYLYIHTYIQSLEWYDHSESRKYLLFEFNPSTTTNTTSALANPSSSTTTTTSMAPQDSKHILSPRSPGATPSGNGQKPLAHINSLAQQEVEHALKDFEITNQVGSVCVSVYGVYMYTRLCG